MAYKNKDDAKAWHKQYNQKRYTLARNTIDELKDVLCADCQKAYPPWVMDFDHTGNKKFNIAKMTYQKPELIREEAAKCDIVCANCHRQRTHNRNNPND